MANYSQIEARVKNFMEDDYPEFDASFDTMLENAELRISKELNTDAMIEYVNGTLTTSTATLARAAAVIAVRRFEITVNSEKRPVFFRQNSFISDYWPNATLTGVPLYYGNQDEANWILAPTPDSNYPYSIETEQRITGLSELVPTTWLSLNQPDLLFYACLLEGGVFDQDSEDQATYLQLYQRTLDTTIGEVERNRSDLNNAMAG